MQTRIELVALLTGLVTGLATVSGVAADPETALVAAPVADPVAEPVTEPVADPVADRADPSGTRRVLLRLAPNTIVQVDADGGRWLYPSPQTHRLTIADMFAARILRDEFQEAGLESLEPLFREPPRKAALAAESGLDRWVVATFPTPASAVEALAGIEDMSGPIEVAELDGLGGVAGGPPDDPWFGIQYGMQNQGQSIGGFDGVAGADVNVLPAWDWTTGSEEIVVAVLDSGMSWHEDFEQRLLPGWNVPDGNDSFADECSNHGTHVTGILGAEGDNNQGVAGVDWRCSILPIVVVDGCTGVESWVAEGIVWAVDNGADVINMSLQYSVGTTVLADAVAYAEAAGVVQIAATGNSGDLDDVRAPAKFPETIAVAATDNRDRRWSSSSGGPEVDVAAPGWLIYSCASNFNYVYKSGTSMATPFVTGAVSLMKAIDPSLTPETIRAVITATAEDIESPGWDPATGHGRLDVAAAILTLDPEPPAPGDLDRDGRVDGQDFGLMLAAWGFCPDDCEDVCPADLNGDCEVDGADLGLLLLGWTG